MYFMHNMGEPLLNYYLIAIQNRVGFIMRKPRVVICNYNGLVQHDLVTFFRNNGYETFVLTESVTCPISGEQKNKTCACPVPCCDIMVVMDNVKQKRGVDNFNRQFQLDCNLTCRNKAIITPPHVYDQRDDITAQDTNMFNGPLDFSAFEAWVWVCKTRFDLSQRLVVTRRANRHDSSIPIQFRIQEEDDNVYAQTVNMSNCGICIRTSRSIEKGQTLYFRPQIPTDAEEGIVQWVKKLQDGWYLTGVTFCV